MSEKMTILFVEDDPEDVQLTLLAIKHVVKSYEVIVAGDGVEALNYLLGKGAHAGRDEKQQPELVILDLNLPKLNGIEVLLRLNAEWGAGLRNLKIAVLSSAPVEQYRLLLQKLGVKLHLQKPIDNEQTAAMVQEIEKLLSASNISLQP